MDKVNDAVKQDKTAQNESQNHDSAFFETDYGIRKINKQNQSRLVAIPPNALENCGCKKPEKVNVKLVQENGRKYIKITPLDCTTKQKHDSK